MSSSLKYATVGTGAVALAVLVSLPFLDAPGRVGVTIAALIALPVQITSYAVLVRFKGEVKRFLVAWVGGTLVRLVVIGAAALIVVRAGLDVAIPMLFALATFFFGLLLLEPVYFRSAQQEPT